MKKISITLMSLFIALSAWSDVTVSVTGTADSTKMGYDAGESYTFNWTINDEYDGSDDDFFGSGQNYWNAEQTTDPELWSDVSGEGLNGTYSRPSEPTSAPDDEFVASSDGLQLTANNDNSSSSSMGLTVNGVDLKSLYVEDLTATGLDLDYSNTNFVNPATWADEYAGTYDSGLSVNFFYVLDKDYNRTNFTATSFEIVPEPASVAMLGLISGLGLFIRHWFLA